MLIKTNNEFIGEVVKSNDIYDVIDNVNLEDMVTSLTVLHPGKETSGHSHNNQEEVYVFLEGYGEIQIGEDYYEVKPGYVVVIKKGEFHKVFNYGQLDMKFVAIFNGSRSTK